MKGTTENVLFKDDLNKSEKLERNISILIDNEETVYEHCDATDGAPNGGGPCT